MACCMAPADDTHPCWRTQLSHFCHTGSATNVLGDPTMTSPLQEQHLFVTFFVQLNVHLRDMQYSQ